jgi:hypothetical protein
MRDLLGQIKILVSGANTSETACYGTLYELLSPWQLNLR